MPTYEYRCPKCEEHYEVVQTIGEYTRSPLIPVCCDSPTERYLSVVPGLAVSNALCGDRHYDGLKATDGTDISTRTKHREYMKRNNLTLMDDFKGEWSKAQKEREALRTATFKDPQLRQTIEKEVYKKL